MIGRIVTGEDGLWRLSSRRETILNLPFCTVTLPARLRPRHVRRAARFFVQQRVYRAVAPAGFPFWAELQKYGVEPVEPGDFCRAAAAPIALAALKALGVESGGATVVLRGERVTRAMRMSALALCPQVRNLLIAAPVGGAGLQAELRREFGVPALEDTPGRMPDLAVHFSPLEGRGRLLIDLSGARPALTDFSFGLAEGVLPEDAERLPLLCALWENGRVRPEQITVFTAFRT